MQYRFTVQTDRDNYQSNIENEITNNKNNKNKRKLVLRIFSLFLIPLLLTMIGLFLIYPHYNKIVIAKESLNAHNLTNSTTIDFFTRISPKKALDDYSEDFSNELALEYIDPKLLSQVSNSGDVKERLEFKNTKISIRSANIEGAVIDGEDAFAMERGPWHFPLSKGPGERGNFVIIGHRFAELPPSTNTFFNLDKIDVGDKIVIKQEGNVEYSYTVINSKVIDKNDRTVLSDQGDYRITLITCTPLWTSKQRLVVTGVLDKAYDRI